VKLLILGSGGRESALTWKLAQSPQATKLYAIPGNPQIERYAEKAPGDVLALDAVKAFALEHAVDLVVPGPEAPLVAGIKDSFDDTDVKVFGPSEAAAQLEGSKVFAKETMRSAGVPTAPFEVFDEVSAARKFIEKHGAPVVVKADGLAAGKGVIVAKTKGEALAAVETIMVERKFGEAGARVVIEDCLEGQEVSLQAFCDGETFVPMVSAQDYKRAYDHDEGPNTGGMGCYAPVPFFSEALAAQVEREILRPLLETMASRGTPYTGVLYAGLMLTSTGPQVLEFNCRFGDPETQVVLPLLESDLLEVMLACTEGRLKEVTPRWSSQKAVSVVMASEGYPGAYEKGKLIEGLEAAEQLPGVLVFQAGTRLSEGKLYTNGGRVLNVVGKADTFRQARRRAYEGLELIKFEGAQWRTDIAARAEESEG